MGKGQAPGLFRFWVAECVAKSKSLVSFKCTDIVCLPQSTSSDKAEELKSLKHPNTSTHPVLILIASFWAHLHG